MNIRIVSPSGALEARYIDEAAARLRAWGHEVSMAAHVYDKVGRYAGSCEDRLADLNEALHDETVDVVLCSRGGYGMAQYVDQLTPAAHYPLCIGFSDITALHAWLGMQDVPSVHGIMCKHIATLAEDSDPIRMLQGILNDPQAPLTICCASHPLNRQGTVRGTVIGGNLSLLYGGRATSIDILNHVEHPILFIEDISERAYHIDRMMHNLRMSGVMERLAGLVIGQFSDCQDDPSMLATTIELIRAQAGPYDYPICANFPAGHVDYNLPLFLNKEAELQVTKDGCQLAFS